MTVHVPIDVWSPDQLSSLIADLQTYRSNVRNAQIRAKAAKTKKVDLPEAPEPLANLLRSNKLALSDTKQLDELHSALNTILKTAPVVHITLAATAGRTLKRQLTVWFRTQIAPYCLLTFVARPDIGGGLMLQAGSHFYDFSFRDRLLAHKQRLMEIANV